MSSHNLFSVSLISAGLALFYSTSLRDLPSRQRVLPAFIGSFIRAPRFLAPRLSRDQGYSYVAETDVDSIDSFSGASPFVVLEDGKPLKRPFGPSPPDGKIALKAVREKGEGRYIHSGRRIFFSPSDNGDPTARKYLLLETLTLDPGKLKALLALHEQRDAMGNDGAWLLAKLQVYAGDMLTIGGTDGSDPTSITLRDIRIDLERWGLARLQAGHGSIRWIMRAGATWQRVTLELRDLVGVGLPADAWLTCVLGFTGRNDIRLEQLVLGHGATTWLRGQLDWSDDRLEAGDIACIDITPLRRALDDACGGPEMQRSWITSFINAIRSGDLPLGGQLEAGAATALIRAFSPDGADKALALRLTRRETGIAVSVGEMA